MKTSCISHPEREPLVIIREWQLDFCEGDKVAAALLSFFEYWHNIKLDMQGKNQKMVRVANKHGEKTDLDITLWQHHTVDELRDGIMNIAKSKNTINKAIDFLIEKGAISVGKNPNPRFNFDKTRHFHFHPETCNIFLTNRRVKNDPSSVNSDFSSVKSDPSSVKSDPAIPETTTETSLETTIREVAVAAATSTQNDFSKEVSRAYLRQHFSLVWRYCIGDDINSKTLNQLLGIFERLKSTNDDAVMAVKYAILEYSLASNDVQSPIAYITKIALSVYEHLSDGETIDTYTDSRSTIDVLQMDNEQLERSISHHNPTSWFTDEELNQFFRRNKNESLRF